MTGTELRAYNQGQAKGLYLARKWALLHARELRRQAAQFPTYGATLLIKAESARALARLYKEASWPLN